MARCGCGEESSAASVVDGTELAEYRGETEGGFDGGHGGWSGGCVST